MTLKSGTLLKPLTLAVSLYSLSAIAPISSASAETDAFCMSAGAKNNYDCSKADPKDAGNQAAINSKLEQLQRWLDNEADGQNAQANQANSVIDHNAELQSKIEFNSQLLATELQQARELQDSGNNALAFSQLNDYLNNNPKDANAWLLYGSALVKRNKLDAAEDIFSKLIRLYPDAPEAYNNLAAIHAIRGDNEKAVDTLLQAFNTHPSYAQIQQNLKAIYANLANQAYNRALDLDSKTKVRPPQLATLDQVYLARPIGGKIFNPANQVDPIILASTAPLAASITEASKARQAELQIEERSPEDAATVQVTEPDKAAEETTLALAELKEPATPLPNLPEASTTQLVGDAELSLEQQQQLSNALNGWASAWSDQNVTDYLDHYISSYQPDSNTSNRKWKNTRQIRLSKPTFIRVGISDVTMSSLPDGRVHVVFLQDYTSNSFQDSVYKSLTFARQNRQWKITAEKTL